MHFMTAGYPGALVLAAGIAVMGISAPDASAADVVKIGPPLALTGSLAARLKQVASVIWFDNGLPPPASPTGARFFHVRIGGFDTHANQLGQHERLLNNVAAGIQAFYKDMAKKGYGDKVAVMCFSEFGRRVNQNSSGGTDHGAAAPMFLIGDTVKGGFYGEAPSLSALDRGGSLKYTVDFRQVYQEILESHLQVDAQEVLGKQFERIAAVRTA